MKYADIKPDTSLYGREPERSIALAKVIQAKEHGAVVEGCFQGGFFDWTVDSWDFSSPSRCYYRVKPEPVVTKKTEWKLYVPMPGGDEKFDHPANLVNTFNTRAEALGAARSYAGFVLIVGEYVTYHDGVEVSREVSR